MSLILFGNKIRKGLYYPMTTLNYENIRINRSGCTLKQCYGDTTLGCEVL